VGVYFRLKPRRKTKKTKARVPNCAINWLSFELHFTSKISALDYQKITRKHNKLHKYTCLLCFLTSHDFLDGFLCHKVIKTPSKRQNSFPTTAITQNARRRRNFKDFTSLLWLVEIRSEREIRPIIAQFEFVGIINISMIKWENLLTQNQNLQFYAKIWRVKVPLLSLVYVFALISPHTILELVI
jgi:hypothetical protein